MGSIMDLKKNILEVAKNAYDQKLFAGTSGNLSGYAREKGRVVITPSSIRYESMTLEDLVVIDLEGNVLEGKHQPSSEWKMHCMVYKECEEVSSVFHTHSPYATSFAVSGMSIPLILIEMLPFLGGDVPLAKLVIAGTDEMAAEASLLFKNRNACLLANHGVLTIGSTVDQAYIRAEYVEDAAKIYHYAKLNGQVNLIPDEIIKTMGYDLKGGKG